MVPAGLNNVVKVFAMETTAFALKSDGTVVSWGDNTYAQRTLPALGSGEVITEIRGNGAHGFALTALSGVATGVTTIGAGAFSQCAGLISVSMPSGLIRILDGAFEGCTSLATVNVPITTQLIGSNIFPATTTVVRNPIVPQDGLVFDTFPGDVVAVSSLRVQADLWSEVQARGVLRWGDDAEGGAPYIYHPENDATRLIGFEVEFAEALAARLGVREQFVQNNWDMLLPALRQGGNFDVVIAGMERTPENLAKADMSRPYFVFAQQLVVRSNNAAWR